MYLTMIKYYAAGLVPFSVEGEPNLITRCTRAHGKRNNIKLISYLFLNDVLIPVAFYIFLFIYNSHGCGNAFKQIFGWTLKFILTITILSQTESSDVS